MNRLLVHRDERGVALVIAMLILLVMTLLGLVLMAGASLNRSLAGNDQRMRETLNLAEAGVGEALSRIRSQEAGMLASDPDDVCQVFTTVAGSVPVVGADTIALATAQPAGQFLDYSTPGRGPDVLTISWKKDPTGTMVMRYDPSLSPALNTATGLPVYVVRSTGRVGRARRTVVAEVIQKPFNVNVRAALAANVPIDFVGNAFICGYNHSGDTQYDDGDDGRPAPIPPDPDHCEDNEVGSGHLPGAWSTGSIGGGGASGASGSPLSFSQNQTGFYAGPWEAFTMPQSEFYAWLGAPTSTSPSTWDGIYYWDNNSTTQDQSATLALHSVNGEGFLYVDGDLRLNAGFHYKGIVYVEGDFDINGQAWILGGIIVNGRTKINATGGMTILYSREAITQALAKFGGQFVTLSWREE
jgi:hypothetical protein